MVYIVNGSFLALDLVFFASASTKLLDGGLFPLGIALIIVFLMLTWRKGEEIMAAAASAYCCAASAVWRAASAAA